MTSSMRILAIGADDDWREIDAVNPVQDNAVWYLFVDRDAILRPGLGGLLRGQGAERPDIDIFYGDEVVMGAPGQPAQYICKPAFDRTQLLARDYVGLPIAVRARAMAFLGSFHANAGPAGCYDLLLRAMTDGMEIDRLTEVMAINPSGRLRISAAEQLSALRRILPSYRPGCQVWPGLAEMSFEIRREFDSFPDVTLIIPTLQVHVAGADDGHPGRPMILSLLEGIGRSDWPMERLNVLIGDDLEDGSIYESRSWPFRLKRLSTARNPGERFNYAKKINALWRAATTEHLIILNDDLLVRGTGWIRALMTFAVDEGVGGVGARLLYPNGRIQHAGMPAGVLGPCTHAFIGRPGSAATYQDWAVVQREWSIVTGAVFATRRSVLEQVNGFDERFSLDYNDVDLCLRLRLLGYRIVYTPYAELTHFESASRGKMLAPPDQTALFLEKWRDYLRDDPAYHPNLTRTTPDIHSVPPAGAWWATNAQGWK